MTETSEQGRLGLRAFRHVIYCGVITIMTIPWAFADSVDSTTLPAGKPLLNKVIEAARASANDDYKPNDHGLNEKLKTMGYQAYRAIRFDAGKSLWRGQNDYEVQLFHPGFLYQQPVTITTVGSGNATQDVAFDEAMFSYDRNAEHLKGLTDENTGFAGFRVHFPIKSDDYKDEFAVFLGASYFRLIGKNQVYGLSARGLALDTGLPKGEQFPHFTHFWLVAPGDGQPLTIYARLESPSVAGAYAFTLTPGTDTKMHVESWLFAREDVEKLGIAPFTSMFLYGENSTGLHDDYRPEVHDSDGILMVTKKREHIWRPLTNPARLQITSLSAQQPHGFGMLQRDTQWENYLDAEANYHARPGLWVTPESGFKQGRLELVEIPTPSETHDNIVAFWVPEKPLKAGEGRYFSYNLKTVESMPFRYGDAMVLRTRQGASTLPGQQDEDDKAARRFVVDFTLPSSLKDDINTLSLSLEATGGQVYQQRIYAVKAGEEIRATFLLRTEETKPVDMRMALMKGDTQVSETWNYVYLPGEQNE